MRKQGLLFNWDTAFIKMSCFFYLFIFFHWREYLKVHNFAFLTENLKPRRVCSVQIYDRVSPLIPPQRFHMFKENFFHSHVDLSVLASFQERRGREEVLFHGLASSTQKFGTLSALRT